MPCTRHRVFLATLIAAAKYLNDSSPKNKHWAAFAQLFDPAEVNLMEKQLLFLLDYDLRFDQAEAIKHFAPFMAKRTEAAKETRAAAVTRVKARVQAQISLHPTPPHDVVTIPVPPVSAASGVQSLVKRLSFTYLSLASVHRSVLHCELLFPNRRAAENSAPEDRRSGQSVTRKNNRG